MSNVNPPQTSYEWQQIFLKIKKGEGLETCLFAMRQGKIEWIDGVAVIFSKSLLETIDFCLKRAHENFQALMKNAGNENDITAALRQLGREFKFAYSMASLPCLPEEAKRTMQDLVRQNAKNAQQNLEKSAMHDRTGRLAHVMRHNSILNFCAE